MHKTQWLYCPECKTELQGTLPACPNGHFTKYSTPVASTSGFIRHNEAYLVLRRGHEPQKGEWDIPGGFVNAGETAEEAVIREIKEETGLNLIIERYIGNFPTVYGSTDIAVLTNCYTLASTSDRVILSDENSEYAWMKLDEIPTLAFSDCQQALETLKRL